MGIRDTLNEKPAVAIGLGIGLIVIAVVLIFWLNR